ncbi:MAG: SDR family NAD(P)-dependent oxidoreductase [Sphingobacteriales bacterium JAD_PAG50586_3]|nr:MAG: SDR family NAD(P)-dependent oxidoreductase [Sphingobacteriales bacterium JAD_PAG50586_3]
MLLSETEKNRLKNKYGNWALITGASSGIGLELAKQLAYCGFNLVLASRNMAELEKAKKLLLLTHSVTVVLVPADVSTQEGINSITNATQGLGIGLFIASAGYGTSGEFIKADIATEQNMLRVNCEGLLILTHYYARQFATQKEGA